MIYNAFEKTIIKLGFFGANLRLPFMPFIYFIGHIASLSLIVYPYASLQVSAQDNQFYFVLQMCVEVIRQLLQNYQFQCYTILFLNFIMLLFWICSILVNQFAEQRNVEEMVKEETVIKIFYQWIAFFSNIQNVAFIIPTISITLFNLQNSLQQKQIFWIINNFLFLVLITLQSFGLYILSEGILEIRENTYTKTQLSFIEYSLFFLRYSQAFIFVLSDANYAPDTQAILYIIITMFEICSIYITKAYVNKNQIFMIIFVNSIGFIICLVSLFDLKYPYTYSILLTPFIFTIAAKLYQNQLNTIITKEFNHLDLTELDCLVCQIFSSQKLNNSFQMILNSILFSRHFKNCMDIHCQCSNFSTHTCDPRKMMTIPDSILLNFQKKIIDTMKKKLQQSTLRYDFYLQCHLISAQQQLGEVHDVYSKIEDVLSALDLSVVQRILWKIFIIIIKRNLYNNLTFRIESESKEQLLLSKKISKFVQSESFNQSIKDGLINIIQKKIDFQSYLLQQKYDKKILNQYYLLIQELEKQEKILKLIYEKFPSQKNQSQLMFYYGEVMQDWQHAYDQLQTNALDNNILEPSNDIDINRLTSQMSYIVFSFEERKLQIKSYSKKSPAVFGYDAKMFDSLKYPEMLIPRVIRDTHNLNIEEFLTYGKGYFFRKKAQNICSLKSGFLQNLDFFYDLYFDSNQSFRFICFFSILDQCDPIILLDQNDKIQGLNKQLFKQLNFNPKLLDQIQLEKSFFSLPASLFFPSSAFTQGKKILQNVAFNFPKESALLALTQQSNSSKIQQFKADLINYEVTIEILQRQTYKIIKIKKIQETESQNNYISMDTQSLYEKLVLNEDEQILMPYEGGTLASPEDPYYQQVMLETQRRTDVKLQSFYEEKHLTLRLSKQAIVVYNYSDSGQAESENKTIEMLGNVYKEEQKRETVFGGASQASSLAGLRKSHFYRKYSLINQLNNPKILSTNVFKIFWLLTLAIIGQIIFIIININYSIEDFNSLSYYYESIQINHYFIEPMQRFFLTRYMLQDYQIMSYSNFMTTAEVQERLKFIKPLLINTYLEFKQNFQDHFQDETLSEFIVDQYVMIKEQTVHRSPIKLQTYNMTLFNAFSLLLDAFYKQQQTYISGKIIPGTNPSNTFQYVNYNLFVTIFDQISDQVYQDSISKINLVIDRWIVLLIPTSLIICILLILFAVQYNKQNQLLERFFDLSKFVEIKAADHDISRQQFILRSLKTGSDLIHKYKFNLIGKEEFLKEIQKKEKKDQKDKKDTISNNLYTQIKIPKAFLMISTFFFFIQFALIVGPLTYEGVQYMQRYPDTVSLFKSFSDIGVYIPAAFSQKEILYFWEYFSYLTSEDKTFFKNQIQKAIEKINEFQKISLNQAPLQFSDPFIDTLLSLEKNNLCPKLNSSNYYNFDHYCNSSQFGILKLGLMPALSAFSNILKEDVAIDFPSDRESPPKDQLEAVYLCSDVIAQITLEMQEDINKQSQNMQQLYQILDPIALTFGFFLLLLIYFKYRALSLKLHRTKIIAYTLPTETVFLDDHFERELRRLAIGAYLI